MDSYAQTNKLSLSRFAYVCSLLALFAVACQSANATEEKPAAPKKVLFIGNSLTAANELPEMVEALSQSKGRFPLECRAETAYCFSLEDHWNAGKVRELLTRERWDFVVLQQGPSSLADSRANLRQYVRIIAPVIRKAGAKPALYMVWPDRTRFRFFDQVRDSYRIAAEDVQGIFLPAGEAWRAAWQKDPNTPLYSADEFHPSLAGTYLAALVIYQGLTGDSPKGLPNAFTLKTAARSRVQLPRALAEQLQRAAIAVAPEEKQEEKHP